MANELAQLDTAEIHREVSAEHVGALWMRLQLAKRFIREVEQRLESEFIDYIEANGPVQVGDLLYIVSAEEKTTKCNDTRATAEAIFEQAAGDVDQLLQLLVAQPFKPGACKQVLAPEKFAECFRVDVKRKLKADGTQDRKLVGMDTRYVRSGNK